VTSWSTSGSSACSIPNRHTVARIRDRLAPDVAANTIAAYAAQHDWAIVPAYEDYVADDVHYRLLWYEHDPAPTEMGAYRDERSESRFYRRRAAGGASGASAAECANGERSEP
jgi:hypothetical protein